VLTKEQHKTITAALRDRLPYGSGYTKQEVWNAYQKVYEDYPDYLKAIEGYFK